MPASFQELLNSRLFKFIVDGKDDGKPTEFLVHEEAMAQLSKPLSKQMRGNWPESENGCAVWNDVGKETFERLVQFAYTGDYSVPKTEERSRISRKQLTVTNDPHGSTSNARWSWDNGNDAPLVEDYDPALEDAIPVAEDSSQVGLHTSKKYKKKMHKKRVLHSPGAEPVPEPELEPYSVEFQFLSFPLLTTRNNYDGTCDPAEDFEPGHSYSNVFLSHASLYALADYRLIDSLKALALYKLHKTLCVFQLNGNNTADVIDLARYAYSEEGGGLGEGVRGLRRLVCHYMATNALVLSLDDGFMDFLADGGQFVKDFFKFEVQRTN